MKLYYLPRTAIEAEILFAAAVLFPRCFFLSTDTDVGGSKQTHVLLSETCYQTCTRMYRFDKRFQKPHLHYTSGKKDFCFNRCPGDGDIVKLIKVIFYIHIIISFYFTVRICIAQFPILVIFILPYPLPISLLY